MHPESLEILSNLPGSRKHDFTKSRFGAMKFQLLGNEALVDYIIRCNLCGAAQPADLHEFCKLWSEYTLTEQYMKAVKESEKKEEGHVRRAKKIWKLKQKISRGKWIADFIDEAWTLVSITSSGSRSLQEIRCKRTPERAGGAFAHTAWGSL